MTEEQEKPINDPEQTERSSGAETVQSTKSENGQDEAALKVEAAVREAVAYKDQLLRKAAEFENYKRRMENELRSIIENATEQLIIELLPVLDDFDRFLRSCGDQKDYDVLVRGVELISNKLTKILSLRGVAPFESVGKPFDVDRHDALLQVPRGDVPPHTVIEEVSRGYLLNGKVLRHAKVIVSVPSDSQQPPAETNSQTGSGESKT
jgi:molecular chaperone GrpE